MEINLGGPILIFDSGIGGLSVFEHVHKKLSQHDIYYLFDNARLPYGDLSEQELIDGCVKLVVTQAKQLNASIVVVACNSASTLVLPELRKQLSIPVVGVVPAIKPAAQQTTSQHIALLATPGTVNRAYTQELITEFAGGCQVDLIGSSELVLIAEDKAGRKCVDIKKIEQILQPIRNSSIDTVVLGCTHFPFLRQEIAQVLGAKILLLDSGSAIATRVLFLIGSQSKSQNCDVILKAGYTAEIGDGLKQTLTDYGFTQLECLSIAS